MTEPLFRADAYARETEAIALNAAPGRIVLNKTCSNPQGGGPPGDRGVFTLAGGESARIVNTVYDADRKTIVHVPEDGAPLPAAGEQVKEELDWQTR